MWVKYQNIYKSLKIQIMLLEIFEQIFEAAWDMLEELEKFLRNFLFFLFFFLLLFFFSSFFKLFIYLFYLLRKALLTLEFASNAFTIRTMAYYCYSNDFYCKQYFLLACCCFLETFAVWVALGWSVPRINIYVIRGICI